MSEFFAINTPDPPHWTLNPCFGVFHSVWEHLESFHYCMKLGAKWAELVQLMQKFVPRSRVGIFTTNAPDPPHRTTNWHFCAFRTIWVHSGPFGCLTKLGAKLAELVRKFVPQSRVGIFRNEHIRFSPCDPKLTFWCVRTICAHSGPFGCLTKLSAKRN